MLRWRLCVVCALAGMTTPALAIDWPGPETPSLTVTSEGVSVSVPAPVWLDHAIYQENRADPVNVKVTWLVPVGFDSAAEQAVVQISDLDHWNMGLFGHLDSFFRGCAGQETAYLDLPDDSPTLGLVYALCSQEAGTARGKMLFGVMRGAGDLTVDIWYATPVPGFPIADESGWPMSRADLEATARALDAAVTVEHAD